MSKVIYECPRCRTSETTIQTGRGFRCTKCGYENYQSKLKLGKETKEIDPEVKLKRSSCNYF